MNINIRNEEFEHVRLFGKPALFTDSRIATDTVPDGWHCYDLRGSDDDPGDPVTIEQYVVVNHAGSVLTHEKIKIPKEGFRHLGEDLDFLGESLTLQEFCEKHGFEYLADNQIYRLCPASESETGLFYTMTPEQDAELGCIGRVRMDFGRDGDEFWTTWHPRGDETMNSPEFKAALTEVVNELRRGPLKSLYGMSSYCYTHGGALGQNSRQYGYIVETPNYRYCLRCNPQRGDYNAYLTCFDLRVQRQQAEKLAVGRVSFASGEEITYTNPEEYLKAIREELPYHATSGFRYQTFTDDPQVRKVVDDEIYNLFGEKNPRALEEYENPPAQGINFGGM